MQVDIRRPFKFIRVNSTSETLPTISIVQDLLGRPQVGPKVESDPRSSMVSARREAL
jgi:hypothetical protein